MPERFARRVAQVVAAIPRGQTLSYGMVAVFAGRTGAARAVARALRESSGLPWWRVIRADRTLAPEVATEQARLLRREGISVKGRKVVKPPPSRQAPTRSAREKSGTAGSPPVGCSSQRGGGVRPSRTATTRGR